MDKIFGKDARDLMLWDGLVSVRQLRLGELADVARFVRQRPARELIAMAGEIGMSKEMLNEQLREAYRAIREDKRTDQEILEAIGEEQNFDAALYLAWMSIRHTGKTLEDVKQLPNTDLLALIELSQDIDPGDEGVKKKLSPAAASQASA